MKILLAYDGSSCADAAVADLRNAGLPRENEVLVVTVAHDGWPPSEHSSEELGQFGSSWKALFLCIYQLLGSRGHYFAHRRRLFDVFRINGFTTSPFRDLFIRLAVLCFQIPSI